MAQVGLRSLRRGVRAFRKRAERRDVVEIPVLEPAHVDRAGSAGKDFADRIQGPLWEAQAGGEIVCRAARNIAEPGPDRQRHQPVCHFVERAVASDADDHIVPSATCRSRRIRIPRRLRDAHRRLIARGAETVHNFEQVALRLHGACARVYNEKHPVCVHSSLPSVCPTASFVNTIYGKCAADPYYINIILNCSGFVNCRHSGVNGKAAALLTWARRLCYTYISFGIFIGLLCDRI